MYINFCLSTIRELLLLCFSDIYGIHIFFFLIVIWHSHCTSYLMHSYSYFYLSNGYIHEPQYIKYNNIWSIKFERSSLKIFFYFEIDDNIYIIFNLSKSIIIIIIIKSNKSIIVCFYKKNASYFYLTRVIAIEKVKMLIDVIN